MEAKLNVVEKVPICIEAAKGDTLYGIIMKSARAACDDVRNLQRFSMYLEPEDAGTMSPIVQRLFSPLEVSVSSGSFYNGMIESVRLNSSMRIEPKEAASRELLLDALHLFGNKNYLSLDAESRKSAKQGGADSEMHIKWEVAVSGSGYPFSRIKNEAKLPEEMHAEDSAVLEGFLQALNVPYTTSGDFLHVKPRQWRRTATFDSVAAAYLYGVEKGLNPWLYSSALGTTSLTFSEKLEIPDESKREEAPKVQRYFLGTLHGHKDIEEKEILAAQQFLETYLVGPLGGKRWYVSYVDCKSSLPAIKKEEKKEKEKNVVKIKR